jgi:DNA invertase Pin-like site-specific DNA recombinase
MKDQMYHKIAQAQGYAGIKEMLEDLCSTKGVSTATIANLIGCSLPTVKTLREQYSIECKPKPTVERATIPQKELLKKSCSELATKYKTSKSHIWRLKQEAKESK